MGFLIYMQTILFIDGENFTKKIKAVFQKENQAEPNFDIYNFEGLLNNVLSGIQIDRKIFYFARLKEHPETKQKSKELIEKLRRLRLNLEKQNFEVIFAGRVRGYGSGKNLTFKEKGVDVRIAVDMIINACDGSLAKAILGSSDSDLQPAIAELIKRKVECVYLGFEIMPNKGLVATTNRSILIRNSEIISFAGNTLKLPLPKTALK